MKIRNLYKSTAFAAVLGLMSSPILVTAADADRETAPGAATGERAPGTGMGTPGTEGQAPGAADRTPDERAPTPDQRQPGQPLPGDDDRLPPDRSPGTGDRPAQERAPETGPGTTGPGTTGPGTTGPGTGQGTGTTGDGATGGAGSEPGASLADGLMMAENRRDTDAHRPEGRRDDRGAMEAAGDFVSDAALTTRVNAALAANRELSAFAISVDSNDGLVTLSGEVESDAQIALAERVVSDIDGVREVHNTLTSEKN